MAVLLCFRLRLDLNFLSLLPPDNIQTRTFFEVTEKVGLQSILISSVDMPREMPANTREAVVRSIADRYARSTLIDEVDFRRDQFDLGRIYPVLLRYLPHLLKPDDVGRLHRMVTDEEIHRRVRSNKKLLLTPFGVAAKQMVVMDPLGLGTLLEGSLSIPSKSLVQKGHNGFYSTGDGNYLIFLKPRRPPQDIRFSKCLMAEMKVMEADALQAAQPHLGPFSDRPTISHTGGYPIAVNDEATTKKDIKVSLVTSIIGVLTLFGVCFRTIRTLVHVTIPLGMSIVWTMGSAGLLFGHLNLLTCIFSCVLVGLGIDFAIHFINRFYSPDKTSDSLEERLASTYQETGAGIIIGALTTAAAFMSIGISDFRGFRELGVVTGVGILFCLLAMLFVLPALLVRSHAAAKGHAVQIAGFGLPRVIDLLGRHPLPSLGILVMVAVLMMMAGTRVGFDDNLKNFRSSDDQTLKLQDQVTQWLGGSSAPTLLVLSGPSEPAVMNAGARIWRALKSLETSGQVADVTALQAFFPPPEQQAQNLKQVRQLDWRRIQGTFRAALSANGLKNLKAYDDYFKTLQAAFGDRDVLLPSHLADTELQPLLQMFLYTKGDRYKSVIYVRPTLDLWSRRDAAQFRDAIETHLISRGIGVDQFTLTGAHLLSSALKTVILENLRSALLLAVAVILATLWIYYRRLLLLVGALSPLVTAMAMLAGIMVLFRIHFNFINVVVLPMVVGIGIDDGVHLTNTYINNGERYSTGALAQTGRGVMLTSLTTMVGFGSIALSHYPGLKSMGYVAVIGVGTCLLTSLFLLPPILSILGKANRRKGGE